MPDPANRRSRLNREKKITYLKILDLLSIHAQFRDQCIKWLEVVRVVNQTPASLFVRKTLGAFLKYSAVRISAEQTNKANFAVQTQRVCSLENGMAVEFDAGAGLSHPTGCFYVVFEIQVFNSDACTLSNLETSS
jgi:hypothetical protein